MKLSRKSWLRAVAAIGPWLALTSLPAAGADPAAGAGAGTITEIQIELNRLGYRPGKADGTLKETTRRAIRNFERVQSRKPTGEPSPALLAEIRMPCELYVDNSGYKKVRGGCPRPTQVSDIPDVYLLKVGRTEVPLKLEPLESDGW
jgi:peptidoglycan hydrolase-like protein with peptidoglycan-binding domain